ncbi:MAG: hypothetical protein NXI16_11155 [Alphaproteobacteria bacterium]|nr:hypothetical protein [Alphaproteobacteria bacterium]
MRFIWMRPAAFPVALMVLLCLAGRPGMAEDGFVPGTEDVPLAPGLIVVPDSLTVFDAPKGRLVEVYADVDIDGRSDAAAIAAFYADTLPALGWRREGGIWVREKEQLDIAIEGVTVRFALRPLRRTE